MDGDFTFTPRMRVACVSPHETLSNELTTMFRRAGFDVANPDDTPLADLGVIDLRRSDISPRKAKAIASVVRRKSPECSMLFLVDQKFDSRARAALRRFGEVLPVNGELSHVLTRSRQIIRLRNVAEETGERLKSLASLNRLVDFPMIASSDAPPRVLIAGAPGPAAIDAINAVSAVAGECICVLTPGQAMRALEARDFDCAIILPMTGNDPMLALTKALRRHSKHAATAVIQIAEHVSDLHLYARRGAQEFILKDHLSSDLAARVQLAARRVRLMRAMRQFLRACNGDGVRDNISGTFTATFLTEHGARLCSRASQTGRPLSLLLVSLQDERDLDRTVLHQAAKLINRVTRAEDMAARIASDKFLIALPATPIDEVSKIGLRIEGVLSNTAFHNSGDKRPFALSVATFSCPHRHNMTIEESIAILIKKAAAGRSATPPQRQSPQ